MNKYNEYMSHIEVTDEMRARVLANVSKAIEEQKDGAAVTPVVTPIAAKKKPVPIVTIISIAATVLIVGGIATAFALNYFGSNTSSKHSHSKTADAATEAADYAAVDAAGEETFSDGAAYDADEDEDAVEWEWDSDMGEESTAPAAGGETTDETALTTTYTKVPSTEGGDVYSLLPISNVETSMTEENGTRIIALNGDENNAVIYIAQEGTDLTSLYLGIQKPDTASFAGNTTNGVTDSGIDYWLYNTADPDSTSYNAASFTYAGNTYLLVLDNPVPEENIREFISEY